MERPGGETGPLQAESAWNLIREVPELSPQAGLPARRSPYSPRLPTALKAAVALLRLSSLLTVAGQRRTSTGLPDYPRIVDAGHPRV